MSPLEITSIPQASISDGNSASNIENKSHFNNEDPTEDYNKITYWL